MIWFFIYSYFCLTNFPTMPNNFLLDSVRERTRSLLSQFRFFDLQITFSRERCWFSIKRCLWRPCLFPFDKLQKLSCCFLSRIFWFIIGIHIFVVPHQDSAGFIYFAILCYTLLHFAIPCYTLLYFALLFVTLLYFATYLYIGVLGFKSLL